MMKEFTGNKEVYIKCRTFLQEAGYPVRDAIHLGDDRFEFDTSDVLKYEPGIHKTHKILAWVEGEVVKYKTKESGFVAVD